MQEQKFETLMQGLVAGFIGFLTVAIVFAIGNLLAGRSPFYTAAVLGATLFYGVTDLAHMSTDLAPYVFAYNGAHLFAFLLFGLVGAWLMSVAERGAMLWYPALFFFIFIAFHLIAMVQWMALPVESAVPTVSIWLAGILAATLMALYLLGVHPMVRKQLHGWQE
jgi:hypothetical protein